MLHRGDAQLAMLMNSAYLTDFHPSPLLPSDGALCSLGHNYNIQPALMKANIFSICMWPLLCWRWLEAAGWKAVVGRMRE